LALNLGADGLLGSDVGNQVGGYAALAFWLAGERGEHAFQDDLGSGIVLRWDGETLEAAGSAAAPYSVARLR
jgi:hypothetical protein